MPIATKDLMLYTGVFYSINFFQKKSGIVWIQISPDVMSGLIWLNCFAKVISRQKELSFLGKELSGNVYLYLKNVQDLRRCTFFSLVSFEL